ncbi:MAG: dTMP kinase [Planctomycetales bacterium]|nr:dTMP kinase [Planctomycetales bacterium]
MFFSFDGIDGAGKTTQIELFAEWLADLQRDVVVYRDPGSTELSERIRDILLDKTGIPISDDAEMLLYMTARTQLLRESILPDLAAGKTVIIDRYVLATLAYQGHAGNVPRDAIRAIGDFATRKTYPDATFVLDIDPNVSHARRDREPDRMEERGLEYLATVRKGFLAEAEIDPSVHVIDANQSVGDVQAAIRKIAEPILNSSN